MPDEFVLFPSLLLLMLMLLLLLLLLLRLLFLVLASIQFQQSTMLSSRNCDYAKFYLILFCDLLNYVFLEFVALRARSICFSPILCVFVSLSLSISPCFSLFCPVLRRQNKQKFFDVFFLFLQMNIITFFSSCSRSCIVLSFSIFGDVDGIIVT